MKGWFLLFLCMVVSAACSSIYKEILNEEWETYKLRFSKAYETELEEALRRRLYAESKLKVADHNQRYYEGKESHLVEINHFSDMLPHEWDRYKGFKVNLSGQKSKGATFIALHDSITVPYTFDWRDHGAVTTVKDQGECGSCWAFSALGSLEGQHFRKTKELVDLSVQNLVDCVPGENCSGGYTADAFMYVKNNSGIDTEKSYPYTAVNGICHFNKDTVGATDEGYVQIPEGDEKALMQAVATVGPISVGIDASGGFMSYKKGVYYAPGCSPDNINHAVLIVGYGTTEKGEDYWLVKNSWGTNWGLDGYIMMARNKDNNCGIVTIAIYPLV